MGHAVLINKFKKKKRERETDRQTNTETLRIGAQWVVQPRDYITR